MKINGFTNNNLPNVGNFINQSIGNASNENEINHNHKPDSNKIISELSSKLGLNDNQILSLKNIFQKNAPENQDDLATIQASGDKVAMKAKMEENFNKINSEIKSILTSEQSSKFDQLVEEKKSNFANMRNHEMHGKPDVSKMTSKLSSQLSLNDNQMIELKSLLNKTFNDKISENNTNFKEKIDLLNDSIIGILNDEQKTKFTSLIKNKL